MPTPVRLLSAEDVERLPPDLRCELIDGILIELQYATWTHGLVTANLIGLLGEHVKEDPALRALAHCGFILRRNPDTVREPDASIMLADRPLTTGYPVIAPVFVAEVIDEWDTPTEIQGRIRDWLEFGVRLIWLVDPEKRTVQVIRSLTDRLEFTETEILSGEPVLPDFACPVAKIFE